MQRPLSSVRHCKCEDDRVPLLDGLAVFQQDIIAWIVLLDERVFKQQRILLRIHHRITDIVDLTDEHLCLETIHFRVEVRRDSRFEILRLTHIDDGMILVIYLQYLSDRLNASRSLPLSSPMFHVKRILDRYECGQINTLKFVASM